MGTKLALGQKSFRLMTEKFRVRAPLARFQLMKEFTSFLRLPIDNLERKEKISINVDHEFIENSKLYSNA